MTATDTPRTHRDPWLLAAGLALLVVLVFGRNVGHDILNWDDRFHLHDNARLAPGEPGRFSHFWRDQHGDLYIPISYNAYALQVGLSESLRGGPALDTLDPRIFHSVSILLHAITVLLVFVTLRRLVDSPHAAAIGAALFAVHPLQVETVAWISEQRGQLALLFSCLATLLYIHAAQGSASLSRRLRWWAPATVAFALALLSKPSAAAAPLVVIAIDLFILRSDWRRTLMMTAPWLALAAGAALLTSALQDAEQHKAAAALWIRPLVALDALGFYLWKLFVPIGLAPDHGRTPEFVAAMGWRQFYWAIPIALAGALVVVKRLRPCFGPFAVYAAGVAPVLGLVSFHHQEISTVADRYAALALLGPAIGAAMLLDRSSDKARRPWKMGATLLLVALAALSFRQSAHWRDDITLFTHNIEVNPRSGLAHNNIGFALLERDRPREAIAHFDAALEIDANTAHARTNLGMAHRDLGDLDAAAGHLRAALDSRPHDRRALNALGVIAAQRGNLAESERLLQRAIEADPESADAHANLALTLQRRGRMQEALDLYETAIHFQPRHVEANFNLGLALEALGRREEAMERWRLAAEIEPGLRQAHHRLGMAHLARGEHDEAATRFRTIIELDPADAGAWNNLGMALALAGRTEEAIEAFREAVRLAPELEEARENLRAAEEMLGL